MCTSRDLSLVRTASNGCVDKDAPFPDTVKSLPHVAFEVDDLARALEGKEVLVEPNCPSPGVTVAMIIDDGAPIELLEFRSISDHQGR